MAADPRQPYDRLAADGYIADRVVYYAGLYPRLREVAYQHGYALALHGSMKRDLDVVAVPWTEEAAPAEVLIVALTECAGGWTDGQGTERPHGRRTWAIVIAANGGYIDVSVMPRCEGAHAD